MANDITTKVWDLDTTGIIWTGPVSIDGVSITWKLTAGTVKQVTLNQVDTEKRTDGAEIFFATQTSVTTDFVQTQFYPLKGTFDGVYLSTLTSVDKLLVYIK